MDRISTFDEFIAPLTSGEFIRNYYGKKPVHCPNAGDRFSYLADWSALNELIEFNRFNGNRFRLAKSGSTIPWSAYSTLIKDFYGEYLRFDVSKVHAYLADGATLILERIEEFRRPLKDLCEVFEGRLKSHFHVDAFASFHKVAGFGKHWDPDGSFVAQISGKKNWKLYRPTRNFPLGLMDPSEPKSTDLFWEGTLSPGDCLYLPRGWWHEAMAVEVPSLHITFGNFSRTGLDVANYVLKQLEADEFCRADLPIDCFETQDAYIAKLRTKVLELFGDFSASAFVECTDGEAQASNAISLPYCATRRWEELPPGTLIKWRPPRKSTLHEANGILSLKALGTTFKLSPAARPVLEDLMELREVSLHSFVSRYPCANVLALVGELLSAGLLTISTRATQ